MISSASAKSLLPVDAYTDNRVRQHKVHNQIKKLAGISSSISIVGQEARLNEAHEKYFSRNISTLSFDEKENGLSPLNHLIPYKSNFIDDILKKPNVTPSKKIKPKLTVTPLNKAYQPTQSKLLVGQSLP